MKDQTGIYARRKRLTAAAVLFAMLVRAHRAEIQSQFSNLRGKQNKTKSFVRYTDTLALEIIFLKAKYFLSAPLTNRSLKKKDRYFFVVFRL